MDQLFKKFRYESKSTALWTELKSCLLTVIDRSIAYSSEYLCSNVLRSDFSVLILQVQEPLTQVYAKMIEFIPQSSTMGTESLTQWLEILCLVCKVFHSLCFQDLPEYFEVRHLIVFHEHRSQRCCYAVRPILRAVFLLPNGLFLCLL